MFEILAIVIAVLVVAIVAVLLLAWRKPDTFSVRRTASIHAPPEKIFPLITDFRRWQLWSPWEGRDPAMQRTFGGAAAGQGAVYEWRGDRNVGAGRMEILDAAPQAIVIKLDFLSPFEAHNTAEFTFLPQGDSTIVTWLMHGPAPLLNKVMQVFMNMDEMIGKDFAAGLANLKRVAEAG